MRKMDIITTTIELFVAESSLESSFSYRDYKSIHHGSLMAALAEYD